MSGRGHRIEPGPGQESVWDYPRPPRLERTDEHVVVRFNGVTIADSHSAWRVLETSHAPTYYIPPADIAFDYLHRNDARTYCEFKGVASYGDLVVGDRRSNSAGWWYDNPTPGFTDIAGAVCFYPELVDECLVDDEVVQGVPGSFYGDWVTSRVVGPFKGGPGTAGW